MARFNKASLTIPNLHPKVPMHSIKVGLRPSSFSNTLYADTPFNMDEFHAQVARYMSIEENVAAKKQA